MEKSNFEADKQMLLIKIEALKKEFGEFSKRTSSKFWRTTGTHYRNLDVMEDDVKRFTEITAKELQLDWVKEQLKD